MNVNKYGNISKDLRPIMFVGTGSDVGKSVICTAFCRIFLQDGYNPAPFKAQNMSLNSFATPDGLEIGRAQAVQAEACGLSCSVEMNPVLLKPTNNMSSQVVLWGKPVGNKSAAEYFNEENRNTLFAEVTKAFDRLKANYMPLVMEGAGSISEVNLWERDIVNMRMALHAKADVYLVADIDRGGVFACVYGTMLLLPENERALIKGIIINKFRGDINLFLDGKQIIEKLCGVPVVGIVPYFTDIIIEQEDSVVLSRKTSTSKTGMVNIVIVLLQHMSNFTDFQMLEQVPGVNLHYSHNYDEVLAADIVIIPGSKNTIGDMLFLRKTGMAKALIERHKQDKPLYGICGGYQIMGKEIHDPLHIESDVEFIPGLGILPVVTTLSAEKKTEQCRFSFLDGKVENIGYEIHVGNTTAETDSPLCKIDGVVNDGYYLNSKTWGTYIHGIFDNANIVRLVLDEVSENVGEQFNYADFKESQYDKLAQRVRECVDMDYIYKNMEL